jgi:multidrug resistance efflux pump
MRNQKNFDERVSRLPVVKLVRSSRKIRWLAKFVMVALVTIAIGLLTLPWQQTSRGYGRVIAFVPQERQQTVSSPMQGIVYTIAAGLREGDRVSEGDVILQLQPAAASLPEQLQSQIRELEIKLETTNVKQEVYRSNVRDFTAVRDYAVKSAQEMLDASLQKLESKKKLVAAYEAKQLQAELNYERQLGLLREGARSQREVEILKRDLDVAISELESVQAEVRSAEFEVAAKRQELEQKRSEGQTKIDSARAYEQSAISEATTVRKEITDLQIKLDALQQMTIRAPRDGTIFRLPIFERGQVVKEGEALFTIVPETSEMAVELWISGLDIPLVQVGDHVRLQFEGWPAIQFAGWPSVAVGTFGGTVVAIDDTDNGQGEFRIQIRPDDPADWPSNVYLRQGVRVNGWVMLQQVRLGYELWRQMNGFPPSRSDIKPSPEKSSARKLKIG